MPHTYQRTIRLADTDAAGIVFFANYLVLCHEAYESALSAAGLPVQEFITSGDVIVPIAKSSVDYLRPLQCGDEVSVTVKPGPLSETSFAIDYEVTRLGPPAKVAARARTEHVCTSRSKRERVALSAKLAAWVNQG
jgi:1,4-dihydroxy-2-naphthoyl-CoA hydrolase